MVFGGRFAEERLAPFRQRLGGEAGAVVFHGHHQVALAGLHPQRHLLLRMARRVRQQVGRHLFHQGAIDENGALARVVQREAHASGSAEGVAGFAEYACKGFALAGRADNGAVFQLLYRAHGLHVAFQPLDLSGKRAHVGLRRLSLQQFHLAVQHG